MATYLMLLNWTDQGIRNVKESLRRLDAKKKLAKDFGGEVKTVYLTQGSFDLAVIAEMPDDEKLASFGLETWVTGICTNDNTQNLFGRRIPENYHRSDLNRSLSCDLPPISQARV